MRLEDVKKAIEENPDAKAVFVNNPTYYGICSDLRSIARLAHEHGMLCLADEAHDRGGTARLRNGGRSRYGSHIDA